MEDIFQILTKLPFIKGKCVLATIIHVEGSAYKKEGSCMLIEEDGQQIGMLSAGCLEEDLTWKAKQVMIDGDAKIFTYDMKEETDMSWGQGAGCNGILHILLEPMNEKLKKCLLQLASHLDDGHSVLHIKQFDHNDQLIATCYLPEKGEPFADDLPYTQKYKEPLKSGLYDSNQYIHLYKPKPRLYVFGAGHDARPFVELAANTGFSVTVCDWRPALCDKRHFPKASKIIIGFPNEIVKEVTFTRNDFVVIMTHHFQRDKELLATITSKDLAFLGILGPQKRTARLLEQDDIPPGISSPIGMEIGAIGAEEIAVSIVAEMIYALRKRATVMVT
ncbi:XdhC family protein [Heyndrickxia vini]|uniref:XdhC family protein n=1 Tax=Heyndrickxia vini TaxID=1476025 RepID=A0ABX7E1Y7_9BACI|nr:XdhC family protein [Heyndrickxia vini]QQZ09328.1 XdhC family protein [Heyndrickxia vini]